MATTIAQYYSGELFDWDQAISFYNEEIDDLHQKLLEVIRRNTIVGIAQKVNEHQKRLQEISDKFDRLGEEILRQEAELKKDSMLLDNTSINTETDQLQADLRRKMQAAEKEYIDVKFECYNFMSGTLQK